MISLFNKRNINNMSTMTDPKLRYLKERLSIEIKNTIEYYNFRNGKVNNNNMLVRLITTTMPDYNLDIFDYISKLDNDAIYYSKNFDIVSKLSKGSILNSVIFGDNSKELFIYKEDTFDIMEAEDNWKQLRPIRTKRFEGTDTSLVMPSNKIDFDYPTLSIFNIDVRMLLVQYKYWSLNRIKNDFSTDPAHFIYSYVFPSMIEDILDLSIVNRLININNGITNKSNNNKHPFNILDMNNTIDKILTNTLKYIKFENKEYSNILSNIHLITADTLYDLVLSSDIGNKQNKYALWLCNIPYIIFLLDISDKHTYKRNKDVYNDILILLKQLDKDRALDHISDQSIRVIYDMNISYIEETIKEI